MNRFRQQLTVLALIGSLTGLAIPADADEVMVIGAGNSSCGSWIQERHTSLFYSNVAWIQGYLRGWVDATLLARQFNRAAAIPDPVRTLDAPAITSWVDQYCDAHRLDALYVAAGALALEVAARAVR